MRDEDKEQLSALIDDELRRDESRFLAARVGQEREARDYVGRYVLIRHALDHSLAIDGNGSSRSVADGVARALESEPAHQGGGDRGWRQRAQPIAGVAVAAGVAALTIGLWPQGEPRPGDVTRSAVEVASRSERADTGAQTVADSSGVADVTGAAASAHKQERFEPGVRERLTSYMVNHSEHAASGSVGGMLTYIRIAGHDADE